MGSGLPEITYIDIYISSPSGFWIPEGEEIYTQYLVGSREFQNLDMYEPLCESQPIQPGTVATNKTNLLHNPVHATVFDHTTTDLCVKPVARRSGINKKDVYSM